MCFPSGARVGSNRLGWTSRTKGRSWCRPPTAASSEATISSSVPPRWTVARPRRLGRAPGDRPVERPVELEDPGAVAVAREAAPVAVRQPRAGDAEQLARRDVEEDRARIGGEVAERLDVAAGLDRAAELSQVAREGVGEPLGAAARHRPADRMGTHGEDDPEGRAGGRSQRDHRVRAGAGDQGASTLALEARAEEAAGGADAAEPEAGHGERMARRAERAEELAEERVGAPDERTEEPAVGALVGAEAASGELDRPLQHHGRAVVERVRQRRLGMRQLKPVALQRQLAQEGRGERK